jgi:para-nitrobenzyl esterase
VSTVVETVHGRIEGTEEDGLRVFRGVPYAAPPLGEGRLRGPRPPEPRPGVRRCDAFGPWASQNSPLNRLASVESDFEQSEDCLTLNVWTPGLDQARRPVMVWIHGGGFTGGSGASLLYHGDHLARRGDVVMVTINYRLGILGFLAHPDLLDAEVGASANWGMLDQVAALEWVRDNIAAFGGDPGNVTIFGESAGGMSVGVLLGMPKARGLFHRAVCQSGAALAASPETAAATTESVLAELGLGDVTKVRDMPVEALLKAQETVAAQASRQGRTLPLIPAVDGSSLPRQPLHEIRDGLSASVPVMVGTNRDEYKMFAVVDPGYRNMSDERLRRRLNRTLSADHWNISVDEVIDGYRHARAARGAPTDPAELYSAIESDRIFRVPAMRMAEAQAAHQPDTYAYLFDWESPAMHGVLGSCHALEIPFVLGSLRKPMVDRFAGTNDAALALAEQMQDAWLAFARTGSPGPEQAGIGDWPRYEPTRRATMIFGRSTHVEDAPFEAERRVWDGGTREA